MNKKLIRLTESDLHRIVKEAVNSIINETSDKLLTTAMDKADDKVKNYEELYGKNSYPASAARTQRKYFGTEYQKRFDNANDKRRANMEKLRIDNRNKREGTTGGQRERDFRKKMNPKKKGFMDKLLGR